MDMRWENERSRAAGKAAFVMVRGDRLVFGHLHLQVPFSWELLWKKVSETGEND